MRAYIHQYAVGDYCPLVFAFLDEAGKLTVFCPTENGDLDGAVQLMRAIADDMASEGTRTLPVYVIADRPRKGGSDASAN